MSNIHPMDENERYYTPRQIAEKFGVGILTVYAWIRKGRLKAYKVGQWRITEKDLIDLMESSPNNDPVQRHNKK